jgi:hypothetical protein
MKKTKHQLPRIFYLDVITQHQRKQVLCRTLAHDLDEAIMRAIVKYGPLTVHSSGTCAIPATDDPVYGRGEFLFGKYDYLLPPRALLSLSRNEVSTLRRPNTCRSYPAEG